MITDVFLREIPPLLRANSELKLYGSVLRHADGRIAGFLQETSGLSKIAEMVASGPMAPVKLVGDVLTIVQNEQIKSGTARLEQGVALLNQLGVANLAVSAVGIGVSAVGFAVMNRKIDRVRDEVRALGEKLEAVHADVRAIDLTLVADRVKQLRGLARSVDNGWTMSDEGARSSWRNDAGEARRLHDFFEGRAEQLLADQPLAVTEATPLLDASAMASGLRVATLALSGEMVAAINVAREDAVRLEQLTGGIGAADLARGWLAQPQWQRPSGSDAAGDALALATREARATAATLRAREAVAATRAAPLLALDAKGLRARGWLGAARAEENAPLLLMEA